MSIRRGLASVPVSRSSLNILGKPNPCSLPFVHLRPAYTEKAANQRLKCRGYRAGADPPFKGSAARSVCWLQKTKRRA
jgi:hypothetical protein